MNPAESASAKEHTWTERAGNYMLEHGSELALGVAGAALLVAGRAKLIGAAESFLPKLGSFVEKEAAGEVGFVRQSAEAHVAEVSKLHFTIDSAKVAEAFGKNARALPSMNVVGEKVEQRIAVVDAKSPLAELYDQADPSIFKLYRTRGGKDFRIGTAFLTEDNFLATAEHCTTGEYSLYTRIAGGNKLPLSVAARDISADVALLKFQGPVPGLPEPLKLGWASTLKVTDPVINLGYPASSNKLVMTDGPVAGLSSKINWRSEIKSDIQMVSETARILSRAVGSGGSSGAPLIANGEVVGVHVGSMVESGLGRATTIEHVRLLLDQVRKNPIPPGGLDVKSIGRVLGKGGTFKVKVEKLLVSLDHAIEMP